eukprot:g17925.t1
MFRQRVPDAQIGWFLHTPFPASEYYRASTTTHQKGVMERLFGHLPVILAAENGCLYRGLDGEWRSSVDPETRANCDDWMDGCMDIFDYFKERTPGSYTERAEYSVTSYYDNTQADFGAQQARGLAFFRTTAPSIISTSDSSRRPMNGCCC